MKNYITIAVDTGVDVSGIHPEDAATLTVGATTIGGKIFLVSQGPNPPVIPPDLTGHIHGPAEMP